MQSITYEEITDFIEETVISAYFQKKIDKLNEVSLPQLLSRKNPSLLILKNLAAPEEFVAELLQAYLLPLEEILLGSLLERLAISICQRAFAGRKSAMQGIDLEFERNSRYYIVAIKSSPNWGNSDQIARMKLRELTEIR
jgi:hypothetical protein